METEKKNKKEIKIGEEGFVNRHCWLADNVNHPPSKRCQYCELKFRNCLFFRYLIISSALIIFLLIASFLIEGKISNLIIISIFVLVIVYGSFFDKSTESIVVANFSQKKAKEALEELTQNLQQKVEEQTKDIKQAYEVEKQANEELKRVDEAKGQFMTITQHHLRTPLTSTMGYIDLLLAGNFGKVPAKIKSVIKKLAGSTSNEIKIINDLLNVSEFQLGKEVMRLEQEINVEDILKEIIGELSLEAKSKGIYLKLEKPVSISKISADKSKLIMALTNVVDNAVKYTKQGGILISLRTEDDKLLISIKDTGLGIPKDAIQNLFNQTFHRGEGAQKMFAVGKGVGLFLSAKIIESHKGKIWAESEGEGKGSTFFIELPIKQ